MTIKMKVNFKYILLFIFTLTIFNSCERDDICIDEITPKLVIKFYDKDDPTVVKAVTNLSAKIIIGTENDSIPIFINDTIASVPLKVTENITQYILTINSNNGAELIRDILTISYEPEDVFVGRSCGYKTIFNNTTYTLDSNNWVQSTESITQTIDNETEAHVKIFH